MGPAEVTKLAVLLKIIILYIILVNLVSNQKCMSMVNLGWGSRIRPLLTKTILIPAFNPQSALFFTKGNSDDRL